MISLRGNKKGSLTLEAAISVPIFLMVLFAVIFFIKYVYLHNMIQNAMSNSVREISSYSYIYSVTGMQEKNDKLVDELNKRGALANETITNTTSSYISSKNDLQQILNTFGSMEGNPAGNFDKIADELSNIQKNIEGLNETIEKASEEGPINLFKSMAYLLGQDIYEAEVKATVLEALSRSFMKKHLSFDEEDYDERLKELMVVDGFEGLDYSGSRLFADKKSIELVVTYTIDTKISFGLLPDIEITQRSTIEGWLDGEFIFENYQEKGGYIWASSPLSRGTEIQKIFGKNIRTRSGDFAKYEASSVLKPAELTEIISTDLKLENRRKPEEFRELVKDSVNALDAFYGEITLYDGKEHTIDKKTSKKVLVIIPEGTLDDEIRKICAECENVNVTVEVKEFGVSSNDERFDQKQEDSEE